MRAISLLLPAMALSTAACQRAYVPMTPHPAVEGDDLVLRASRLDVGPTATAGIDVERATGDVRIVEAGLAPVSTAPCTRGYGVTLAVDGSPDYPYKATLHPGSTIAASFVLPVEAPQVPMRIDLLVEGPSGRRCLAVAITSDDPAQAWRFAYQGYFRYFIEGAGFTARVSGSDATTFTGARAGGSFGRGYAYGGLGVGIDQCSAAVCARGTGGAEASGLALPVEAGVGTLGVHLGQTDFFGDTYLGIGARYRATFTLLPTYSGAQWHGYDGLFAVPCLSFGARNPIAPGVPGGTRFVTAEIQFPIGLVAPFPMTNAAASFGVALTLGR